MYLCRNFVFSGKDMRHRPNIFGLINGFGLISMLLLLPSLIWGQQRRYEYFDYPLDKEDTIPVFICEQLDCIDSVDLGLSVQWATCNVGANTPTDDGDIFAWGEMRGYKNGKVYFGWEDWSRPGDSYKWYDGMNIIYRRMSKYNLEWQRGTVDNKTVLEQEDDVAHMSWGGTWRMPTREEWQELIDNCTSEIVWNGLTIAGCRMTSKINGNSIYLPAAGHRDGWDLIFNLLDNASGYYWTSSLDKNNSTQAYYARLLFSGGLSRTITSIERCQGLSIRPVCPYYNKK